MAFDFGCDNIILLPVLTMKEHISATNVEFYGSLAKSSFDGLYAVHLVEWWRFNIEKLWSEYLL